MTLVSHDFSGIADGTTFTPGSGGNTNTPGNTPFDNVDIAAGGVAQATSVSLFDTAYSGKFATRAVGGPTAVSWQSAFGTVTVDHFGSFLFMTSAIPSTNVSIFYMLNAALGGEVGTIRLLASGALDIHNGTTAVGTSSTTLNPFQVYQIRYKVHPSTTVSYVTMRIAEFGSKGFKEEVNGGASPTTWAGPADTGYLAYGVYAGGGDPNWPTPTDFVYFGKIVAGMSDWPLPPGQFADRARLNTVYDVVPRRRRVGLT